jgi:cell division protein ZapA (FtsZ GTPase activity inhibitor)
MSALVFVLLLVALPQNGSTDSPPTIQRRAHDEYERHKQAAIRINERAGRINSEADASAVVSEIADLFAKELPPAWATSGIRQRVAHAEYETVRNPAKLISEQRIADVWNQYVREIGAPDEAIVSVAEIHNMRDGSFTVAQLMWARGNRTIWTMPNMYALGPDGKVAYGCRALEAIRVIHDLEDLFQNLRAARDRLRSGIVVSDEAKKRVAQPNPHPHGRVRFEAHADTNPIRPAEERYLQEHGSLAYDQLLARLFGDLFPPD